MENRDYFCYGVGFVEGRFDSMWMMVFYGTVVSVSAVMSEASLTLLSQLNHDENSQEPQ
jgi:hypothetical protein